MIEAGTTVEKERIRIPETSLAVANWLIAKIRVDPTEVKASGGPDYPRLALPLRLDLNPLGEEKHSYVILTAQCGLTLTDGNVKIADAAICFEPYRVTSYGDIRTYNLEFPLDYHRVSRIEDTRGVTWG